MLKCCSYHNITTLKHHPNLTKHECQDNLDFMTNVTLVKYYRSFVWIPYFFSILLCRPAYGGKFCEGSSRSYQLCNTDDCPPNTPDYRAQQCVEFNSRQFRGWYYTWRPYTRVDGKTIVPQKQGCQKSSLIFFLILLLFPIIREVCPLEDIGTWLRSKGQYY